MSATKVTPLGQVFIARRASATLSAAEVHAALERHECGDWGECCRADWRANDAALKAGDRLVSVYRTADGKKFWIITEHDRSMTTVLLPEEY
jgi:hypothetical protein